MIRTDATTNESEDRTSATVSEGRQPATASENRRPATASENRRPATASENRRPAPTREGEKQSPADEGPASQERTDTTRRAAIQRRLGNAAVQRAATDATATPGESPGVRELCPRCRRRASEGKSLDCPECESALQRSESRASDRGGPSPSAAGVTVNDPNDRYEREAEAVASAVLRMPDATPAPAMRSDAPGVQRMCGRCSNRLAAGKLLDCPECEAELQRSADGSRAGSPSLEVAPSSEVAQSPEGAPSREVAPALADAKGRGRPLPGEVRSYFEPRFDRNFGDVRVHTGSRADDLAGALGATAYTHGRNLFFASGAYRPSTRTGRRLLAHELTHTVQQGVAEPLDRDPDLGGDRAPTGAASGPARERVAEPPATADRQVADRPVSGRSEGAPKRESPVAPAPTAGAAATATAVPTAGAVATRTAATTETAASTAAASRAPAHETATSTAPVRTPVRAGSTTPELQRAVHRGAPAHVQQPTGRSPPAKRSAEPAWYERAWEAAGDAVEWGAERAVEAGGTVYGWGETAVVTIGDTAVEVAGDVWGLAQGLARRLGVDLALEDGTIVLSGSGLTFPGSLSIEDVDVPEIGFTIPFFEGSLSIGDLTLVGTASFSTTFDSSLSLAAGPATLDRFRVALDPLGGTVQSSATATIPTSLGLDAELRAGVGGSVRATVLIPTSPPVAIAFPSVGLRGGLAGHGSGIAQTDVTLEGATSGSIGGVGLDLQASSLTGLEADLGLSGWEAVEVAGYDLCRQHWPLWSKRVAAWIEAGAGVSFSASLDGVDLDAHVAPPRLRDYDLSGLPEEAEAELIADDCWPCDLFRERGWFASPEELAPYYMNPDDRLAGPMEVYPVDPKFVSGATCRGACGPDCHTCTYVERIDVESRDELGRRVTWTYHDVYVCPTHAACREHDACFDWAADEHGETGPFAMLGPVHAICSFKCYCDYSAVQCAGFIAGLGGDATMFFAEGTPTVTYEEREEPPDRTQGPEEPDLGERDGSTPERALPFKWHKPREGYFLYPESLYVPDALSTDELERDAGPTPVRYEDGRGRQRTDEFGVREPYWPQIGQRLQFDPGRREREQRRFTRVLSTHLGADLSGLTTDHVRELQFGDPTQLDQFDNLWPMDSSGNSSAGTNHRNEFRYYERRFGSLNGRWFEITEIDLGPPYLPREVYE